MSLEKRIQQTVSHLTNEKDNEIMQLQQRVDELQQHNENICQQHEEVLLRAENDKQQALLIGTINKSNIEFKLLLNFKFQILFFIYFRL